MAATVNTRTLNALIEAGAIKRARIVAQGSRFHIEFDTPNGTVTALTNRADIKQWSTLDAAARWLRERGLGTAQLELTHWSPLQERLAPGI